MSVLLGYELWVNGFGFEWVPWGRNDGFFTSSQLLRRSLHRARPASLMDFTDG